MIFRMWLKLAGITQLLTPFLIRLVFWLQILGNGVDSNRKLEINSKLLKSRSLQISLSIPPSKIPPFSNNSTNNTNNFRPERKSTTFKEPKNAGLLKVTETQTSSTTLSLRETVKTPSHSSLTLMALLPQLQIK
jgi:hypothetical protein